MAVTQTEQIERLVTNFSESVAQQTDAIARGDAKASNKWAKQYIAAFRKLRVLGDAGRDGLVPLLSHPRGDVRSMAACYLLRHRTQQALAVLRTEAQGKGFVALEASEAIARWKDGSWSLDPESSAS